MKYKKLLLIPILSSMLALSACGLFNRRTKSDTTPDGSSTTETSSEEVTWSDEQKATMRELLYGTTLPYIELEEVSVRGVDDADILEISGTNNNETALADYATKLEADGFAGGDVSEDYDAPEGSYFNYLKWVTTDQGNRCIHLSYYCFNDNFEYATTGTFYLEAYDPYYYAWPANFVSAVIYDTTSEEEYILPPAFTADYYSVSDLYGAVACFLTATTDDAGYTSALEEAGFIVSNGKDEQGYYIAIEPHYAYQLAYLYEEGALYIYIEGTLRPYDSWQADVINAIFEQYEFEPYTIPELTVANATYYFYEDTYNALMYAFGAYSQMSGYIDIHGASEEDYNAYLTTLEEAGFTVTPNDSTVPSSDATIEHGNNIETIIVGFNSNKINLIYTLYGEPKPYETWPEEVIQDLLDTAVGEATDPLPELKGALSYIVENGYVSANVTAGSELTLLEAYVTDLQEAGFTYDAVDGVYYSPDGKYVIQLDYYEETIDILIYLAPEPMPHFDSWPNDLVEQYFNGTDEVIALQGAEDYAAEFYEDEGDIYGRVLCYYDEDADVVAIAQGYINGLIGLGYTEYDTTIDDEQIYASPNNEFAIIVIPHESQNESEDNFIEVYIDNLVDGVM